MLEYILVPLMTQFRLKFRIYFSSKHLQPSHGLSASHVQGKSTLPSILLRNQALGLLVGPKPVQYFENDCVADNPLRVFNFQFLPVRLDIMHFVGRLRPSERIIFLQSNQSLNKFVYQCLMLFLDLLLN